MSTRILRLLSAAAVLLVGSASLTFAGPLLDRITEGNPIRLGYLVAQPTSFSSKDGGPDGMLNVFALNILEKMGYTNVEGVVMDWGALIPAMQADRIDMITAGMYVTKERCANVEFADPMLVLPDVLIVPKGNPKGLESYDDIAKKGAILAEVAGYASIETAKRSGVSADHIIILPGHTQILAALRSGRSDAFATALIEADGLLKSANETTLEITDPSKMPGVNKNWVSLAFRRSDADFVDAFNDAQRSYMGSPEMMGTLAAYGYSEPMLPGTHTVTDLCQ